MPRYVIEREIPEVDTFEGAALREAARKSIGVPSRRLGACHSG